MLPPPAATKPKTPIAFARSAGSVNRLIISDSETAETMAPPRPWTARAPIRNSCEPASPQAIEASGEQGDADQEQAPVPVEITEPPTEQQEAAEGEQVGVDDPRKRRLGEPEVGPDRRQRDVHDRRVEHDHQGAGAEDEECEPALAGVHGHRAHPFGRSRRNWCSRGQTGPSAELIGRGTMSFGPLEQSYR